jgi:hypothetical protein
MGDLGIDGRIILNWILNIYCELNSTGSGEGPVAIYLGQDNRPTGSIKSGKIFDQLIDYKILRGSAT